MLHASSAYRTLTGLSNVRSQYNLGNLAIAGMAKCLNRNLDKVNIFDGKADAASMAAAYVPRCRPHAGRGGNLEKSSPYRQTFPWRDLKCNLIFSYDIIHLDNSPENCMTIVRYSNGISPIKAYSIIHHRHKLWRAH